MGAHRCGTICAARTDGATAQFERILGERPEGLARATELLTRATSELRPEGRPLYAGLLHLGLPGTPLGDMWRLTDLLREYRGDSHTAAWISSGFKAPEIGLLSELFWGIPLRSYVRSHAPGPAPSSMSPKPICVSTVSSTTAGSPNSGVPSARTSRRQPTASAP